MSPKQSPITAENAAIASPRAPADRLYRAAAECVRQRERFAVLVDHGAFEEEQENALKMAGMCDDFLHEMLEAYEQAPLAGVSKEEEWYKRANALWQAARDYRRRHTATNQSTRKLQAHSPEELRQIAMGYEMEASALLALQHAVQAYRKVVPEAHLGTRPA